MSKNDPMCFGTGCQDKSQCLRHTGNISVSQLFLKQVPAKDKSGCDLFIQNTPPILEAIHETD